MAEQPPPLPSIKPPSLWRESLAGHDFDGRPDGVSIGGWLYLLAAFHVLSVLFMGMGLIGQVVLFSQPEVWLLTEPGSGYYRPFWSTVISYEVAGNAAFLIYTVALLYLMVGHKRAYRPAVIIYLMGRTAFLWGDHLLAHLLYVGTYAGALQAFESMIFMIVWVPYMLVSKRVKSTFVR
jgi:hypothetical protein